MRALRKQEQTAVEVVARHFSATCETGGRGSPDAYLSIAGKRIAVDVAAVRIAKPYRRAMPRLRFDRVALGLVARLQADLRESVPDGQTVILTITAPIRLPAKTAAALNDKIRVCLARRSWKGAFKDTIHGNRIRLRLVKGISKRTPKVIGFVHNPDSDPGILLNFTRSLLRNIGVAADKGAPGNFSGDRWLVLAAEVGASRMETYRYVCSQLAIPTDFKKILMVLSGGRVEIL